MRKTLILAAALAAFMGLSLPSHAALTSCPASFTTDGTAKVTHDNTTDTAASDCQYVTPADPSVVANLANINATAFFGFNDWAENTGNLQVNAGATSGSWALAAGFDFATKDYMIVFKDGADTNLVGFLLNEEVSFGDWTTPFTEPPFTLTGASKAHAVSHYTIVERLDGTEPPQETPEPASLALVGLALVGLGLSRRGSRKAH